MLKTKDEVIQGFLERHCSLLPEVNMKSYNTIKSHLGGIWENGFAKGAEDGWDAAKKLCLLSTDGGMEISVIEELFGTWKIHDILKESSATECIEKIRKYEEQQKAEVTNIATNADKFRQVFGYMPEVFNAVKGTGLDTWWDEPYKEHNNGN